MNVFELSALLRLDSKEYENGLKDAKEKSGGFGETLKKGLGTAVKATAAGITAATGAAVGFAKSAVDAGQNFDTSMSQVAATMGYTVDELNDSTSEAARNFETLRVFAQEMGSTTAFSASQAADALNYMALAGYDTKQSMDMLPTVLNLAAAGGIELARASDMVTDAQTALGLTFEETAEMTDVMAIMASKSNTSVEQLGDAFLTIGANARGLSGGVDELSTMLGVMADNGIKGSEAGTHLRNILLSLNPQTDDAVAAWKMFGVSAYDATGNLRPLNDVFADLNKAMDGMAPEERGRYLSDMFNKTDLAAVNALLETSADRFDELYAAADNAKGAAQGMADTQLDNLAGDITLFKSALEGAQIVVSDQLTPALRGFVQFGADGLSALTEAFNEGGLNGAMAAMGTVISDAIDMVIEQLPTMIDAGMQLLGALGQGIIDSLPALLDAALEIIMMLSVGIADALPELIPAIVDTIYYIVEKLTQPDMMSQLIGAALKIIIGIATGLIKAIPQLLMAVPMIIANLISTFTSKEFLQQMGDVGAQLLHGLAEGLGNAVAGVIQKAKEIAGQIVGAVKNAFGVHSPSRVFAGIGDYLMQGLGNGIEDNAAYAIKRAEDMVDDLMATTEGLSLDADVNVNGKANGGGAQNGGDIIIPVYIGDSMVDEIVVDAKRRVTMRSGGYAYV